MEEIEDIEDENVIAIKIERRREERRMIEATNGNEMILIFKRKMMDKNSKGGTREEQHWLYGMRQRPSLAVEFTAAILPTLPSHVPLIHSDQQAVLLSPSLPPSPSLLPSLPISSSLSLLFFPSISSI